MARNITSAFDAQLQGEVISPVLFIEIELNSSTEYMWTGLGPVTWDGKVWQGVGNLLGVSAVQESSEFRANGVSISLSAVPLSQIALALNEMKQNKPVMVYFGLLDESEQIVLDPYRQFKGRLDVPKISDDGESATISVRVESRAVDLERARTRRYTQEDQAARYPNDKGFEYVPGLQDKTFKWG